MDLQVGWVTGKDIGRLRGKPGLQVFRSLAITCSLDWTGADGKDSQVIAVTNISVVF